MPLPPCAGAWPISFRCYRWPISTLFLAFLSLPAIEAHGQKPTNTYAALDAIFSRHCLDCHGEKDPDGQFVLESFDSLMKGGELGPAVVPGKSRDSLLMQMIEGRFETEGKKKIMPPGKRAKLNAEEIEIIRSWIDAGAPAPSAAPVVKELVAPKIVLKTAPRNPINAIAFSSEAGIIAVARYAEVELRSAADLRLVKTLAGHQGNVNALAFTTDGSELYAAGGQSGWSGEVRHWKVEDGKLLAVIGGHKDAIYALALSPDGKTLATGSYDQKIKLWNPE